MSDHSGAKQLAKATRAHIPGRPGYDDKLIITTLDATALSSDNELLADGQPVQRVDVHLVKCEKFGEKRVEWEISPPRFNGH